MGVFENTRKGKRGKKYGISYRDTSGKLRQKIVSNNRKEAEAELQRILVEMENGLVQPGSKSIPVEEYAKNWLEEKKAEVREVTWRAYRTHVEKHILSEEYGIGELDIREVDLAMLRKYRLRLGKLPRKLSSKSVNAILTTLGSILGQARLDGIIRSNPARDLRKLPVHEKEMDYLRPEEVAPLLEAAKVMREDLYLAVCISILAGVRRSELLGLKYGDFAFKEKSPYVQIQRSYHRGSGLSTLKTETSRRRIYIGKKLARIVREFRLRRGNPSDAALVFDNGNGKPLDPDYLSKTLWKRLLKYAEYRESLRWHRKLPLNEDTH